MTSLHASLCRRLREPLLGTASLPAVGYLDLILRWCPTPNHNVSAIPPVLVGTGFQVVAMSAVRTFARTLAWWLLAAGTVRAYTTFYPVCSRPTDSVNFVWAPDMRGTLE